jgi:outer membrane protein assembly factor BamB
VVAVGTSGGDVLAVSLDDGRVLGRATTGGPVLSSPVFDGDRVYVGSSDGVLRAISGWERP